MKTYKNWLILLAILLIVITYGVIFRKQIFRRGCPVVNVSDNSFNAPFKITASCINGNQTVTIESNIIKD